MSPKTASILGGGGGEAVGIGDPKGSGGGGIWDGEFVVDTGIGGRSGWAVKFDLSLLFLAPSSSSSLFLLAP